jgi:hypothetical protein
VSRQQRAESIPHRLRLVEPDGRASLAARLLLSMQSGRANTAPSFGKAF